MIVPVFLPFSMFLVICRKFSSQLQREFLALQAVWTAEPNSCRKCHKICVFTKRKKIFRFGIPKAV